MGNIGTNIMTAANYFGEYVGLFTILFLTIQVVKRKINIVRLGANYIFLFYSFCVLALVFLPLPTLAEQANLTGHSIQAIPFRFLCDIARETPFVWNKPQTYLAALTNRAVLQVVFNVFMTIPFGMYLRYNFHFTGKAITVASFALSSFIEIGQFTGLFFMFHGSYRLCDVDDLMLNTLGGVIGYFMVKIVENKIPAIECFDKVIGRETRYIKTRM